MDPISLDTPQAPPDQVNIDTGVAPVVPPTGAVAQTRSVKAGLGIGPVLKKSQDEIYNDIIAGHEDALRQNAALQIDADNLDKRNEDLKQLAIQKDSALTLQDVNSYDNPPTDPKSVIETQYAKAYVAKAQDSAARLEDNVITDAQAQNPELLDAYFQKGSEVLSKREYAAKLVENLQPAVDNDAWWKVPTGQDQQGNLEYTALGSKASPASLPLNILTLGAYGAIKEEFKLRGLADNTGFWSGLGLGENIDNSVKELLNLPQSEFQLKLDAVNKSLVDGGDPDLAQKFDSYVIRMSTSDKYVNDAMSAVNATMVFGIGKGIVRGLASSGIDAAARQAAAANAAIDRGGLIKGSDGTYRSESSTPTSNTAVTVTGTNAQAQAQKAVEDIVKSANVSEPTLATIAEGAGDIKEAAVQKTINSVTKPDPNKDALNTLMSVHQANIDDIRNNPPPDLSREGHTRLLDAAEGWMKTQVDLLTNTSRVVRTPALLEDGFRAISDDVNSYFPGRENTIMNVDVGRYDEVSNTYHHDFYIGNYNAQPFSSYDLAKTHAERNGYPVDFIQPHGDLIKGTDGVYRVRPVEKIYLPQAALFKNEYPDEHTVKKVVRPFELKTDKNGGVTFHDEDGMEVIHSPKPFPGAVPYNLKTGKFEEPLSNDQMATIEQKGMGFHIKVTIPLDETQSLVRDSLIGNVKAQSSSNVATSKVTSVARGFPFGYLTSPNDSLSKYEVQNRGKYVFGQSKFLKIIQDKMAEVEKLYRPLSYGPAVKGEKKVIWEQFNRALVASQKLPDSATALPGYYMTPSELHDFYQRTFQRPPTEQEYVGYQSIKDLSNLDHAIRNMSVTRNKFRIGVMRHSFYTVKDGQKVNSPEFDGKILKEVKGGEDATLIHDADGSERWFHQLSTKQQKEFRLAVKEGRYHGAEVYDPEKREIVRDAGGKNPQIGHNGGPAMDAMRIRYIFSNALESKPITYDQVGYRGGGHWEYDYDHYVKQPIIRSQWVGGKFQTIYEGDSTFAPVSSKAMGEDFAGHMNEVARLLRMKDSKAAKAYAKKVFDIEWKELYKGFRPAKNPVTNVLQPARFSLDERQPFRTVPKGLQITDLDKDLELAYEKTFVDGTKHGSLARNFQVQFTGERDSYDLFEPNSVGSRNNPFYKFQPAKLTDPIVALTRAMERLTNSIYMDDLKMSVAEHWLEENKGYLKATEAQLRASPFFYFSEGEFKKAQTGIDRIRIQNAEINRYKSKQLMGMPSKIDTALQNVKQTISDSLYEGGRDNAVQDVNRHFGEDSKVGKLIKAPLVAPEWMLDRIHNPVNFFRAMVFHKYLGMGNWTQFVIQNATYANIFAMSPMHATQGSFGALMHQWSRLNKTDGIIKAMDDKATLFGWKPGELTEGMRLLDRSGFEKIGHTLALDNGMQKQAYFRNAGKIYLNALTTFFNAAERHVRYGAYYTAFHEFRSARPFDKIGQLKEGEILARAKFLYMEMSRDSNTMLEKGLPGVSLQFMRYNKSLIEAFWSKNLGPTKKDRIGARLRMVLINSILYGALTGAVSMVSPFNTDYVRQKALEAGYTMGAHAWSSIAMEGPLSYIGALITGHGDAAKGTFYNFSRYGGNGYQIFNDLRSDEPFWKILGGAAGTDIGNTLASLDGFTNAMYSMLAGKKGEEAYPLTYEDWTAPLETIASLKYGDRLIYALRYGIWKDTHGRNIQEIGKADAVFRTLFGVDDTAIHDMFLKTQTTKDEKARFQEGINAFLEKSGLAEQAAANNDPQQANEFNKQAFFEMNRRGLPIEVQAQAIKRRAEMYKDLIDKNNETYYRRNVPTDRQDAAREADRFIQQNKGQ